MGNVVEGEMSTIEREDASKTKTLKKADAKHPYTKPNCGSKVSRARMFLCNFRRIVQNVVETEPRENSATVQTPKEISLSVA